MILIVGQVERSAREREGFQQLDYRAVFGKLAKWVTEIDDLRRLPGGVGAKRLWPERSVVVLAGMAIS